MSVPANWRRIEIFEKRSKRSGKRHGKSEDKERVIGERKSGRRIWKKPVRHLSQIRKNAIPQVMVLVKEAEPVE